MWGRKVLGGTEAGWRAAVCSDRRAGRLRVGKQVLRSTEEKVNSMFHTGSFSIFQHLGLSES